jgi:hypothetical protein
MQKDIVGSRDRPEKLDFPLGKGLTNRGVIYVPSTTEENRPISRDEFNARINRVSRFISRSFGGDTVQRVSYGNWIDGKGNLVKEEIARVEFFADDKQYLEKDYEIGKMLQRLRKKWKQWGISYEYQSPHKKEALYFVTANKKLKEVM